MEDISIAVGEDLFPFFRTIGTTLEKDRFGEAEFMGEKLELPRASIDAGPADSVRLETIGDFRKHRSRK